MRRDTYALCILLGAVALVLWGLGRGTASSIAVFRLLGAAAVVHLAVRSIRPGDATGLTRRPALLVALFVIFAATSFVSSANTGVTLIALADLLVVVLLFLAATAVTPRTAQTIAVAQVILVLPIAFAAAFEPFGIIGLAEHDYFPGRAEANMGGPGPLGGLLAMVLPFAVAFFLTRRRAGPTALAAVAAGVILVAITATFSRAAMLATTAGVVALGILLARSETSRSDAIARRRFVLRLVTAVVAAAVIVPSYNVLARRNAPTEYDVGRAPGTQTFELARPIEGTGLTNRDVRVLCWRTAARMIARRPLVGVGAGCFGIVFDGMSPDELLRVSARHGTAYEFAYDDYLQLGAELGIPALIAFLLIVGWTLAVGFSRAHDPGHRSGEGAATTIILCGALAAVVATLTQSLVDFPLQLHPHGVLFWIDLGLIVALSRGAMANLPRAMELPPHSQTAAERSSGPAEAAHRSAEPVSTAGRPSSTAVYRPRAWLIAALAAMLSSALVAAAIVPLLAEREAMKAVRLNRADDLNAAVAAAVQSTRLAAYEHEYWILLAETLHRSYGRALGDPRSLHRSFAAYRQAIRTRPHHAPTHGRLGALYLSHSGTLPGAVDSAEIHLGRSIELNPYYADPHTNMGTALMLRNDQEAARTEFILAAELDTIAADPLFNLGNLDASSGRPDDALESYRAALRRDPNHFGSLVNAGALLVAGGQYESAVPFLERAAALRPGSERVETLLSTARPHMGNDGG